MDLIKSELAVSNEKVDKEELKKDLENLDPANAEDILQKLKKPVKDKECNTKI